MGNAMSYLTGVAVRSASSALVSQLPTRNPGPIAKVIKNDKIPNMDLTKYAAYRTSKARAIEVCESVMGAVSCDLVVSFRNGISQGESSKEMFEKVQTLNGDLVWVFGKFERTSDGKYNIIVGHASGKLTNIEMTASFIQRGIIGYNEGLKSFVYAIENQ